MILYKCRIYGHNVEILNASFEYIIDTMPFIGRDWRANGEQWTKTEVGSWERPKRILILSSVGDYSLVLYLSAVI